MALPTFTDAAGRRWSLVLTYGLAQRIHKSLGLDLANAHNGEALTALAGNDRLLVELLFALIEEQATSAGVTPEQFADGLNGDVFEAAAEALQEMIRLFTRPAIRPVMEQIFAAQQDKRRRGIELVVEKLSGPAREQAIQRDLSQIERQFDEALATQPPPTTSTKSPTSGRRSRG